MSRRVAKMSWLFVVVGLVSSYAFAEDQISSGFVILKTSSNIVSACTRPDHNWVDGKPQWGCDPIEVELFHTADGADTLTIKNLSIPGQPFVVLKNVDYLEMRTVTFVDSRDLQNKGLPLQEGKNVIQFEIVEQDQPLDPETLEIELVQEVRD